MSSTTATGVTMADGLSDDALLDKLERHEPLLPGRRGSAHPSSAAIPINPHRLSREKSNYAFDEQVLLRGNPGGSSSITAGLTQEALNELVPASRLASRKLYHDIVLRKTSAAASHAEPIGEQNVVRRVGTATSLAPIKPSIANQRGNVVILQQAQQKAKPRSLPNSSLDHANQNGFHLPHDPYASRASKTPSRTSHIDHTRKSQQASPVRYHPGTSNHPLLSKKFSLFSDFLCQGHNSQVLSLLLCPGIVIPAFSMNVLLLYLYLRMFLFSPPSN